MARLTKSLRKIHINDDIWKWYIRVKSIIIFSPKGKRIIIPKDWIGYYSKLTPSLIKKYIEEIIIPKENEKGI